MEMFMRGALMLVATLGSITVAMAQGTRPVAPATQGVMPAVVARGATLRKLDATFAFTEGPACDSKGNIFFTDQPNDTIWKYDVEGKLSVFMKPAGRSNGLCFDKNDVLWAAADEENQLWAIAPDGKVTVVLKDFQGKLLNAPNDLWIRPDQEAGAQGLYFTDPLYKRNYWKRDPAIQQAGEYVYYLSPDHKTLTPVLTDLKKPNGIIGTADGKTLYVSDIGAKKTYRYSIQADGSLTEKKLICEMGSDGMTIDSQGNIYLTGKGVTIFSATGENLGNIAVPDSWTANVAFGGKERTTLFITASKSAYTLEMKVRGAGSQ
jgi:gluconolactonase